MKSTKTRVSEIYVDENEIVHISFPIKMVEIRLNDSREIYEKRVSLTDGKQLLLADLRTNPQPDRDARNFAKSPEMTDSTKALAMLVNTPMSEVLGNFFIGFNKGSYPVRLFANKEKAIAWLLEIKD